MCVIVLAMHLLTAESEYVYRVSENFGFIAIREEGLLDPCGNKS